METDEEPLSAPGIESSFTLKRLRHTGAPPFAQLAYECEPCSFAQHATAEPPACGPRIDARILPLPSCNLTLPSLCPTVSTRRSANAVTVFPSPSPRAQTSNRPEP